MQQQLSSKRVLTRIAFLEQQSRRVSYSVTEEICVVFSFCPRRRRLLSSKMNKLCVAPIFLLVIIGSLQMASGLRFVIDRQECFSQKVEYEWDAIHVSFVVIKYDSSWQPEHGVDPVACREPDTGCPRQDK
ncbi:Transmembrane emp24 domain-containing protein [Drosera capensis]